LIVEKFSVKKLCGVEFMKYHLIKIANRFGPFKNLAGSRPICRTWLNIRGNTKISAKSSLGH